MRIRLRKNSWVTYTVKDLVKKPKDNALGASSLQWECYYAKTFIAIRT